MKRKQKMSFIGLIVASFFLISPIFQNCSPIKFQSSNPTSADKIEPLSSRKVTVDPTFNQIKSDLKVLLIVDDSYTMSQSQMQLANAIESLLNPLQGHHVEFKIVSTSGVPSNEVDYSFSTKYFSDQNIEIPQDQLASLNTYLVETNATISAIRRHPSLQLFRESTSSQFTDLKTQIKNAIQAVGVNGSETEEGLCATVRQFFDESASRFFKPGDKAAVIILSDEDDSSSFSKCSTRYRQRVSTKPVVYYSYGQQRARVTLEYQVVKDGVSSWQPISWGISLSGERTINTGETCSAEDQADAVTKITTEGYSVRNVSACVYEVVQASYYGADIGDDGTASDKNLCLSTTVFNGKSYPNIYSMVNANGYSAAANSCGKQIIPGNTLSDQVEFDSVIKSDSVAAAAEDLKLAILNKANSLFGVNGYIFTELIHLKGENCALAAGQSYGLKYQELNQILGPQKSVAQSLCNNDFSMTLNQVSQFMVSEALNSFVLPLQSGELVLSVTVIRGSNRLKLTSSQYEVVQSSVTLLNYTLLQGDVLEFELGPASI